MLFRSVSQSRYAVKDKDGRVYSIPPSGFQEIANPVAMLHQPRSEKNNEDKFVGTFWGVPTNSTYNVFEDNSRKFLNKVRVGVNVGYSRGKSTGIETNSEYGSILGSALTFSPLVSVYASDTEAANILAAHPYAVKDKDGRVYSIPPIVTGKQIGRAHV